MDEGHEGGLLVVQVGEHLGLLLLEDEGDTRQGVPHEDQGDLLVEIQVVHLVGGVQDLGIQDMGLGLVAEGL